MLRGQLKCSDSSELFEHADHWHVLGPPARGNAQALAPAISFCHGCFRISSNARSRRRLNWSGAGSALGLKDFLLIPSEERKKCVSEKRDDAGACAGSGIYWEDKHACGGAIRRISKLTPTSSQPHGTFTH